MDMITKDDILQYLSEQKLVLEKELNVTKLGLFGSYARSEQTEESDIDLLVEFKPNTPELAEKKERLKSILKSKFYKEVDLCREKYIKPYYKHQILQSVIYV
jgi:uncharacterized protein